MTIVPDLSLPQSDATLVSAARWTEQLLFGQVALTIATIGVAFVGFLMLQGRLDWRRGVTVCLGCFLVFGARPIAGSLTAAAMTGEASIPAVSAPVTPDPPPEPVQFDPYSGASTLQL